MSEEDQAAEVGEEDMADPETLEGEEAAGEEEDMAEGEEAAVEEDEAEAGEEEVGDEAAEEAEQVDDVGDEDGGDDEQMVETSKDGKFCVRLRQGLKTAERVDKFVAQLRECVEKKQAAGEAVVFDDIDISQNRLATDQFEAIFSALTEGDVHVEQLRTFGCPTLDDEAAGIIANWLAAVTSENTPFEMHLSDCAITAAGYEKMMTAFQENEAFPANDRRNPERGKLGVYLRLEQNYIDTSVMQQSIKDGVATKFRKNAPPKHSDSIKVRLLVREDGSFQQKKGDPPAPEDVPEPRPWRNKGSGKGKGSSKGSEKGKGKSKGASKSSSRSDDRGKGKGKRAGKKDEKPPWLAIAPAAGARRETSTGARDTRRPAVAPAAGARRETSTGARDTRRPSEPASKGGARSSPATSTTSKGRGKDFGSSKGKKGSTSSVASRPRGEPVPFSAFGRNVVSNNSSRDRVDARPALKRAAPSIAEDAKRPRTVLMSSDRGSASRGGDRGAPPRTLSSGKGASAGGKGGGKSGGKSGGKQASLPAPWEQHWSDQYKMHYYWNSKTGESSWEKPGK
eukprot:TRINITY_DN2352_c0_g1_i1.p1 TRINITY_DN2352_c0_g1~~TRINITY_DN2352_c0_g1_i1.p1  ORF type:complete len:583 (-),score=134.52 TRINITY_DN2352_c0_g1_i1:76-1773(-)